LTMIADMARESGVAPEELRPETRLSHDLLFSSVDVIHLLGLVEMKYQQKFPYDRLVVDENGNYRDLTVEDIAGFVETWIGHRDDGPTAMR
jgi:acyl carrier protein